MNVIVSNNAIEYTGFLKVNKLENVLGVTGKIDCLVYHKSNETSDAKAAILTKLKDVVGKIVYIRNREDCDKTVKMLVVGSGGKYLDDEFFLENAEELSSLVSNLDEIKELVEMNGMGVVTEFLNKYLNEGSSGFNKQYLQVVKSSVLAMTADYKRKDLELLQVSETATELFAHTANIISKIEEEKDKLKDSVKALQEAKDSFVSTPTTAGTSVMFFPTVSYLKDTDIIRIKEIGNMPYLTSYALGMRTYLEKVKFYKVKLIFIYPVGEFYTSQYKNFSWVTQKNHTSMDGYYSNVVFTNYPTKDVLNTLLSDTDYDVFIVIDRTKFSDKHLLNCKGGTRFAVQSKGLGDRLGIKKVASFYANSDCGLFSVKYSEEYPEVEEQRERFYLREYSSTYETFISMFKRK